MGSLRRSDRTSARACRPPRHRGPTIRAPRFRSGALLALLAVLAAGCELAARAELDVASDGSGSVALELAMDAELTDALDDLGVDPVAELTAAVADDPDWRLERSVDEGGLTIRAVHPESDDPARVLAELGQGLAEGDPGLVADLDVEVDGEGHVEVRGAATFRGPATPGAADAGGTPIGPEAAELDALVAEHVTAELEVRLPGRVVDHDADVADGRTLRWSLPPDTTVDVHAEAEPGVLTAEMLLGGVAVAVLVMLGGVVWAFRRR